MAAESTPKTRGQLMRTVPRLSRFAAEYLLLLPFGAAIALVWANTFPESYFRFSYAAAFAVNDIAMVFFFALMTKEVVEATAPGGVLHPWRRAWLPVLASVGVTFVPAWLHTLLVGPLDEPMLAQGWPVTFAVDVALSYFVARLIFGARHPAVPFVIVMAIASDALGLLTLAAINPSRPLHPFGGIVFLVVAMALAAWLHRSGSGTSGRTWPDRARSPGSPCTGAARTRRWRSCRSCCFCRTPDAIPGSSSTPDPAPATP